ncbi:hypothetical protein [Magnetospirillum sp. LM-5]|uniref:hypothetical protein n=1 Tax=Magnetospirillum sp. LM-5 TaxID=2681466 RepID=UPI00156E5C64|nr:hypothetical protein [Magnetospirillum sp. LM-5]
MDVFGISLVQVGRWIDRGDTTQFAFGKLMQVLGFGAIIFMLIFFIPGYIKTESDKSIAIYAGFYLLIGWTMLIAGLCLIYFGSLLKRRANKWALISLWIVCATLVILSLQMLY